MNQISTQCADRSENTTLINFRMPNSLKMELDHMVTKKNLSRTSVLINLIESWIQNERQVASQDSFFRGDTNEAPPEPIFPSNYQDDEEGW